MGGLRLPSKAAIVAAALCLAATLCVAACDSNATAPTPVGRVVFGELSPRPGSTILTFDISGGRFILKGSGRISIPMNITSDREVPWAQLYVYLLTPGGYCGQNLPDAPTWGPFGRGQTVSVDITGFQVFRVPCEVTGIRAILHTRNTGLLTPPLAADTVVEATLPVNYVIE